ncbi:MAG: DUF1641 domain-containing protein [Ignavibacteriaceae bacterium]|jgi:uncharacterized protein YjgD (DUF1641 family)|nr:DUF1641 domain-containing protein [Ignavibacteriaceae bacterium]
MEHEKIQDQIDLINKKLDVILEEIELQRRHRRQMEDLKDDLTRVGKDLYETAVVELEEMHDQLSSQDVMHLVKKLMRNVNTITKSFEQLESIKDFMNDFSPISREMVFDFMHKLDEFDRKGYFQFFGELNSVMDNIVTSFTLEDIKALGDNVVTILNTVKSLTQPDMLHAINNAVSVYKNLDTTMEEEVSFFQLIKEMNSPEVRKGMAVGLKFLKNLANPNGSQLTKTNHK